MSELERISGPAFHNIGVEAAIAAIAVVIWALVAVEPELSTFTTVRVNTRTCLTIWRSARSR